LLLALLVACAPVVDGPAERQRAADTSDAARVTAQLAALPGVVRAEVLLRRPAADPFAKPAPAAASLVIVVDDQTDRAAITAAARALARAAAPEIEPVIVVEQGAVRPALAKVGPFTVEAGSKTPLKAALGIALALIVALAAWLAVTSARRPGSAGRTAPRDR
jgi:hypothetical protein